MQALLSHRGPLVHVDHSHRLAGRPSIATGSLLPHLNTPRMHHNQHNHHAKKSDTTPALAPATCLWPQPKPGASKRENMKLEEVKKEIARKQHTLRMLVGSLVTGTYLTQMLFLTETIGVLKQRDSDPEARKKKRVMLQEMATAAGTQLPPNQQWRILSLLHELENLAGCKDALENRN